MIPPSESENLIGADADAMLSDEELYDLALAADEESFPLENVSEVVRAGLRMLMERDGARQFYALKAALEGAVREAEAGEFTEFDPATYEPEAFPR